MTFRSYSSLHSHLDRVEEKLREKGYRRVFNSTRPLKPGEYLVRPVPNPDWPSTHEWVLEVETLPRIARRPAGGKGNDAPHPPRESVAAASRLAFEADSARSSSPTDC